MVPWIALFFCNAEFTEQNCAIGFLRGDDFIPLTNFIFRFVCKVSSPHVDNVDYNGFMVEVKTCTGNGKEEMGYIHSLSVHFSTCTHNVVRLQWFECTLFFVCFILLCSTCFFPWHKAQQKGLNISKELGSAVPDRSLISKLKPSQLMDIFLV